MKTIFGFFDDYQQASQAIDKLLEKDFDLGEMNVIVLQSVAKNNMTGGLNRVKVEKTAEVDGVEVHGLERLLAGEQPVNISNLGQVYAGGDLATMLANTASANARGLWIMGYSFSCVPKINGRRRPRCCCGKRPVRSPAIKRVRRSTCSLSNLLSR
jgi:hypothetical protein